MPEPLSTREPLVVFDFRNVEEGGASERSAANSAGSRLVVHECFRTVVIYDLADVLPALNDIDAWCRGGGYAFGAVSYEAAPAFDEAYPRREPSGAPLLVFHLVHEGHVMPIAGTTARTEPEDGPEVAVYGALADGSGLTFDTVQTDDRAQSIYPRWTHNESRESHTTAIVEIRERIASGDVYQVNHTVRLGAPWSGSSLPFYEALYAAHSPPYAAWMRFGDLELVSMSPELFLERRGVHLTTRPMKGTTRRGRYAEEDLGRRTELLASEKERAENVMIVDLLRNDLGKLAMPAGVRVTSLLDAERHSTVWQLTSTVVAECAEPPSIAAAFTALFPSGSITGTPKIAAMRQIARLEPEARGFYCGAVGMVRPGGDYLFNVAIRTVQVSRGAGSAMFGTGGGITWDSRPDAEFDELRAKASLVSEPVPEFDLLETLRLENGVFPLQELHLARLERSAVHFGIHVSRRHIFGALEAIAGAHAFGVHRVRLLVGRDGRAAAACTPFIPDARPWRVALANEPVDTRSVFLFHKTTQRGAYESALRGHLEADDVILWNRSGNLTELTRANLVLELDGELLTPPVQDGLLAGVQREAAIRERRVREVSLTRGDLERATAVWAINALRGWVPVSVQPPRLATL